MELIGLIGIVIFCLMLWGLFDANYGYKSDEKVAKDYNKHNRSSKIE